MGTTAKGSYTLARSLFAGFTLALDSVVVLFTFTHGVSLWCTCPQKERFQVDLVEEILNEPKINEKKPFTCT